MINKTKKIKNNTLAMDAAAATRLKKPKIPATIAMMKKTAAHFNMAFIPLS